MNQFIAAIDQGTTSSRCIIFDHDGRIVSIAQKEHRQFFPRSGWVEHDPEELWLNTREVGAAALAKADLRRRDIAAIGLTNQRETTVVWDRTTGKPVYNAIVWQDTRTDTLVEELAGDAGPDRYREITGLPLSTYFAGPKVRWILDNVDGARERAEAGDLAFGTVDSWILWNLTGGVGEEDQPPGLHITDVTNASRTLLMNLETQQWDPAICAELGIPESMLPEIRSSSEVYGRAR
ncbi:FGGY family carbohydrate kinase, partial [Rhodococcus gordoniae]